MSRTTFTLALVGSSLAVVAASSLPASATASSSHGSAKAHADLNALNSSGVSGDAAARVTGGGVLRRIEVKANGLTPDAPHAMHIHYGKQAKHQCPTIRDDKNGDFRVNVAEGVPQYGPIAVSLTRTGDTTPASALALDRMAVSKDGKLRYGRSELRFTDIKDVDGKTIKAREVAAAVRKGEAVVVVHGIDYNGDGKYGESGAGASELDPTGKTPAEATDPAACGVLKR